MVPPGSPADHRSIASTDIGPLTTASPVRTVAVTPSANTMTARTLLRISIAAGLFSVAACSSDSLTGPGTRSALTVEPPARNPVLFVHGWNSSGAIWFTMMDRFIADGYRADELYNWTYYSAQSNAVTAQQLGTKVNEILAATGASKVDIVTHSMGALSARYYIKNLGGGTTVDEFVSLAGPNHGTNTAYFCGQAACVEMRPNSSFLNALNKKDETPGRVIRYGTWWSACDEVINPQRSTILNGATNVQTACMGHSALYSDATVYGMVKAWVQ
jgi:triacylglycerol lipase